MQRYEVDIDYCPSRRGVCLDIGSSVCELVAFWAAAYFKDTVANVANKAATNISDPIFILDYEIQCLIKV